MALLDQRITGYENKDVASAPDKLTGSAAENKAIFDSLIKGVVEIKHNGLVDYLMGAGAEQIVRHSDGSIIYIRLNVDKVIETSLDGIVWEATGSSGHLIMDAMGFTLPQRSKMQFANSVVTDVGGVTVVTGIKGDKGDTGLTGDKGDKGDLGLQGSIGLIGKTIVPSIDEYGVMRFSVQDTAIPPGSVSVRGPQGPQGVQGRQGEIGSTGGTGAEGPLGPQGVRGNDGADGRSFVIQDVYATLGALKSAIPLGNEYAYQVSFDKNIYIWSELISDWISLGQIQGPIGPQGIQGTDGPQGKSGIQGIAGTNGISAYEAAVVGGYAGTELAFNTALMNTPGHIASTANPHSITKAQVGLSNVTNTSDASKPVSTAQQTALDLKADKTTTYTKTEVDTGLSGKASSSHNQAASTITAGILGGQVLANATAQATLSSSQIRNIVISTTDLTAGTSTLTTGTVYFVYE